MTKADLIFYIIMFFCILAIGNLEFFGMLIYWQSGHRISQICGISIAIFGLCIAIFLARFYVAMVGLSHL